MKYHLVMPMAGAGSRFKKLGYDQPKPLLPLHGHPFFFWAAQSVMQSLPPVSITAVVLAEHIAAFNIDEQLRKVFPAIQIVVQEEIWTNPTRSSLLALPALPDDDHPVAFLDCDLAFDCPSLTTLGENAAKAEAFLRFDGALTTFTASSPNYSYIALNEAGAITHTREKEVISNHAIAGCYWFRRGSLFKAYAEKNLATYGEKEVFMSGIYNEMLKDGLKLTHMPVTYHLSFGTPDEYAAVKDRPEWQTLVAKTA